jgi:hypothetical protein
MKNLNWRKFEIFQIFSRRQTWIKIKIRFTTKAIEMSSVHITETVWIMQVNITGNAGPVWIARTNRNKNHPETLCFHRKALIPITPCHRLFAGNKEVLYCKLQL